MFEPVQLLLGIVHTHTAHSTTENLILQYHSFTKDANIQRFPMTDRR